MEDYSSVKKNEIMKLVDKWKDIGNDKWSEVA